MLLKFKTADLKPLVEHAKAATEWRMGYETDMEPQPALLLVKDHGAYLMSNGVPREPDSMVVYAEGCRPEDGHIGGDDWAETLPLTEFDKFMLHEVVEFTVTEGEDYEWYPTTDAILAIVASDIKAQAARPYRGCDRNASLLDIGAGDGRALVKLQQLCSSDEHWGFHIDDLFAIEKSMLHLANMPKQIVVIGTEFNEQTLVDKEVKIVFCNPPYSEYEDWAYRILRECAAETVYMIIPRRWRASPRLSEVIKDLELEFTSLGESDFETAERRSRAKVEIVRFDMGERREHRAFDEAIEAMLPELERFEDALDGDEEAAPNWDDQLTEGGGIIDALVAAYDSQLSELYETYRSVVKINPKILKELGVTKANILTGLREKIKGLKNRYWQVLFEHLEDVTKRFATKQRKQFLESLRSKTVIDFTHGNVRSMLIWIAKWSNDYFDEQLIDLFKTLAQKCNVQQYKSNQKVWVDDRWRYNGGTDPNSHYKVDYRMVVYMYGAIDDRSWKAPNGLMESCHEFLGDFVTIANNLGFACHDSSRRHHWASNVKNELMLDDGEPLMDVRAFKNGNIHIRVSKRVMLAINVQVGKLLGWIHSAEEAVRELAPEPEDAAYVAEAFAINQRLESSRLLRIEHN
jgi:hypothetical protein